ncbi:MAG: hypothetical protein LH468_09685 [Nocardioides sp.]|nr:hypothetical protein [Nocardioides sp.]
MPTQPERCPFCGLSEHDRGEGTTEELLADMAHLAASRDRVEQALVDRVSRLRGRGVSWARVGESLGVSRQSAWERFSARVS